MLVEIDSCYCSFKKISLIEYSYNFQRVFEKKEKKKSTQNLELNSRKTRASSETTSLIQTPIFEQYMIGCGFRKGFHIDICLQVIGRHAQNAITILDLTITNTIQSGDLYAHF